MLSILEFLIGWVSDFINLMNIELLQFNGVSITWLNVLLVSTLIPIIFSMLKVSFGELNSRNDFNLVNDIKTMSYKRFNKKGGK